MSDNPSYATTANAAELMSKPGMIVGSVGPGGVVTFDDPEMLAKLRRAVDAVRRRGQFQVVED